jgi:hypothetical protein
LLGRQERRKVSSELLIAVMVVELGGVVFDLTVHSLGLTIGPGVVQLGELMLDAKRLIREMMVSC